MNFSARSDVFAPSIISSTMRLSRSLSVSSQAGKSSRKITWSGTGDCVLSMRASCSGLSERVLNDGMGLTVKPRCCWAEGERASLILSLPHTPRPHLTCREAKPARVTGKAEGSLPFSISRRNQHQQRATASWTASSFRCQHLTSRKANRARRSMAGRAARNFAWMRSKGLEGVAGSGGMSGDSFDGVRLPVVRAGLLVHRELPVAGIADREMVLVAECGPPH